MTVTGRAAGTSSDAVDVAADFANRWPPTARTAPLVTVDVAAATGFTAGFRDVFAVR